MLLHLEFSPSDIAFGYSGLPPIAFHWWGRPKAEFINTSPDSHYGGGSFSFLNRAPQELAIHPRVEGSLDNLFDEAGLDARVEHLRTEGFDEPDALCIKYHPTQAGYEEILYIGLALEPRKIAFFKETFDRLFPLKEARFVISCPFYGFRDEALPRSYIPSDVEFRAGEPYFLTGELTLSVLPLTFPRKGP